MKERADLLISAFSGGAIPLPRLCDRARARCGSASGSGPGGSGPGGSVRGSASRFPSGLQSKDMRSAGLRSEGMRSEGRRRFETVPALLFCFLLLASSLSSCGGDPLAGKINPLPIDIVRDDPPDEGKRRRFRRYGGSSRRSGGSDSDSDSGSSAEELWEAKCSELSRLMGEGDYTAAANLIGRDDSSVREFLGLSRSRQSEWLNNLFAEGSACRRPSPPAPAPGTPPPRVGGGGGVTPSPPPAATTTSVSGVCPVQTPTGNKLADFRLDFQDVGGNNVIEYYKSGFIAASGGTAKTANKGSSNPAQSSIRAIIIDERKSSPADKQIWLDGAKISSFSHTGRTWYFYGYQGKRHRLRYAAAYTEGAVRYYRFDILTGAPPAGALDDLARLGGQQFIPVYLAYELSGSCYYVHLPSS